MSTKPKQYADEDIEKALECIKNGSTIYVASKTYNVPYQTIHDKVKKIYTKSGAGARKHWYDGFLKRNPSVALRIAQPLTPARLSVTEDKLRSWFQRVYKYFEEQNLVEILSDPSRIFNCDESAFFLCPKGDKVLAKRGSKFVYSRSGNNEKECLTICVGASAAGKLMPPFVLFPYKRIPQPIIEKYPKSWAIGKSDSGWMTTETFYEYVANIFHPYLEKENIEKPVVLYLDGHTSHISLHLSEFCRDHGIILIALLPNSTHILQPMDVAIFHSLKSAWRKKVQCWRIENNGERIKREDVGPLLDDCIKTTVTTDIIKNGFAACGLYPFNENAIEYSKILKSSDVEHNIVDPTEIDESNISTESVTSESVTLKSKDLFNIFEERLGNDKLNQFKRSGSEWIGEMEDAGLFYFWLNFKNDIENEQQRSLNNEPNANPLTESNNIQSDQNSIFNDQMDVNIDWDTLDFDLSSNVLDLEVNENGSLSKSTDSTFEEDDLQTPCCSKTLTF